MLYAPCRDRGRAAARPGPEPRAPPGAQPRGLAGVGHRAAARLGSHVALPALRQPGHPLLAPALGAEVGRGVEASTVLCSRDDQRRHGAFLADDTMVASYELGGGWMRIARPRSASGRSSATLGWRPAVGACPRTAWSPCSSAAPQKAKAGTSWLGSPPVQLRRATRRRRDEPNLDPPPRLRVARWLVELCRFVPVCSVALLGRGRALALVALASSRALRGVLRRSGARRRRPARRPRDHRGEVAGRGPHPRAASTRCGARSCGATRWWTRSSRWWRPRGSPGAAGTPVLTCGCGRWAPRIGRGVWCETYWLPEADLVELGDGVSVNRGCVLQTHLFHDRVMSMGTRGPRRRRHARARTA